MVEMGRASLNLLFVAALVSRAPPSATASALEGTQCTAISNACAEPERYFCRLPDYGTCADGEPPQEDLKGECTYYNATEISCIGLWEPVCGCDGIVYGSWCEANYWGGVNVLKALDPNNEEVLLGGKCDANSPEEEDMIVCFDLWEPVCGSDGKVYSNKCELSLVEGVDAVRDLNPENELILPGGDCSKDDEKEVEVETMKEEGFICPSLWQPVCGSDSKVYSNKCKMSLVDGVNAVGDLDPLNESILPGGDCSGENDSEGDKEPKGEEAPVPCPAVWQPVCGSDDKVYSNRCEAYQAEGVDAVRHIEDPGDGSIFAGGDCGGGDDKEGDKEPMEEEDLVVCPGLWAPVCGSDGKVHSNNCTLSATEGVDFARDLVDPGDGSILPGGDCGSKTPPANATGASAAEISPASTKEGNEEGDREPEEDLIACPDSWEPVCGSDGKVYSNNCTLSLVEGVDAVRDLEDPGDGSILAGGDCGDEDPSSLEGGSTGTKHVVGAFVIGITFLLNLVV